MLCKLLVPTAGLVLSLAAAVEGHLIVDNFETDTSASYDVLDESNAASGDHTPDSTSAFDYIAAGLPLAPHSLATERGGLRFTVNDDDPGEADTITAFHVTPATADTYTLRVDVYLGVEAGAGGTTEFATVGIGSDASDFNAPAVSAAGDGHFMAMDGEGGSSSDYRHFVEGAFVPSGDASYLNTSHTTDSTGDTYQAIFPGTAHPGSPTNTWTTLSIGVSPSTVTYALDGTPIIRTATTDSVGRVGLGYADVFTSVGPHFVVFDNLSVTVPEPSTLALLGLGGGALLGRRRPRAESEHPGRRGQTGGTRRGNPSASHRLGSPPRRAPRSGSPRRPHGRPRGRGGLDSLKYDKFTHNISCNDAVSQQCIFHGSKEVLYEQHTKTYPGPDV